MSEAESSALTMEELLFFDRQRDALPLYAALRTALLQAFPDTRIDVRKTQISFFRRHMYAAASFTPVRRAADRPHPFLTVTFGLRRREESPRVDVSVEAAPGRWTHHVMIGTPEEVDSELLGWIAEAARWAGQPAGKRPAPGTGLP